MCIRDSSDIVRAIKRKSRLSGEREILDSGCMEPVASNANASSRESSLIAPTPSLRPYRCEYVCKGLARCEVAGPACRPGVPSALSPLQGCQGGHDLTEVDTGSDRGL